MNNWDDIRYFLALARSGSISAAARALGVNHSTVSRRIQALEEKHGVQLFQRQSGGYQMLEAADTILAQAEAIEAQSQQISRTLFGQDARLEGPVNITMPHDIFEYCLSEALAGFSQQYPGIELNVMVSQGLRNLANREADIAIRLTSRPPDYLVGRSVAGLQHALYASRDIDPASEVGIVCWSGEPQLPPWAEEHFPGARIALRVDDLSSMYAAVKAGFGIARMPCYMPDSLVDIQVKKLAVSLPRSDWSVWLLSHTDLRKTARVQKLRSHLLGALENKRALFEGEQ